jgi:hypothetical protein
MGGARDDGSHVDGAVGAQRQGEALPTSPDDGDWLGGLLRPDHYRAYRIGTSVRDRQDGADSPSWVEDLITAVDRAVSRGDDGEAGAELRTL